MYGGIGKAARNWECFDAIVATLRRLGDDETLLVQSGKPVGVFRTHSDAPRVLIANSNLVPHWATWEHFNELDRRGLMMYGQMTAGSWIYIGSQGIVQGTYETFVEMGRRHFGGELARSLDTDRGSRWHGAARSRWRLPWRVLSMLAVECRQSSLDKRLATGYLDEQAASLDAALALLAAAKSSGAARSIGLGANIAEVLPELLRRGVLPDALTDQTSAHDPVHGYLPVGWSVEHWGDSAKSGSRTAWPRPRPSRWRCRCVPCWNISGRGVPVFDYGNNIRQVALQNGVADAFKIPGFVPEYIRPLFCRGVGPFRWVALSGDPSDIAKTDQRVRELIPDDPHLHRWLDMAAQRIQFQGLPARICWVGLGDRHRLGPGLQRDGGLG